MFGKRKNSRLSRIISDCVSKIRTEIQHGTEKKKYIMVHDLNALLGRRQPDNLDVK